MTQLAIDLKIGRTGAALHQTETLSRLGVKSLVLRLHENLAQQYRHVLADLSLLRMTGLDAFEELAVAGGEKLEDLARNPAVMRVKGNQEETKRIMDAIDAGEDPPEDQDHEE